MTKKDTRRKYSKEFKLKVVKEHLEGSTLTELSRIYGIAPSTLGTWFATLKEEVKADTVEDEIEVMIDPDVWEEMEKLRTRNKELEEEVVEKDKAIEGFIKKLEELPNDVKDVGSWVEKVEELNEEVGRLEEEVKRLHSVINITKEDARRGFKALKDAIVILTKEEEE